MAPEINVRTQIQRRREEEFAFLAGVWLKRERDNLTHGFGLPQKLAPQHLCAGWLGVTPTCYLTRAKIKTPQAGTSPNSISARESKYQQLIYQRI